MNTVLTLWLPCEKKIFWLSAQLLLPTKEFVAFNSVNAEFTGLQEFFSLASTIPMICCKGRLIHEYFRC